MIGASRAGAGCIDYAYSVDVLCPCLMRITHRALRLYEADPEPI
jgi:hypothetical protein